MQSNGCHNVAASDDTMRMLPVVNGKKLCAFIDTSYNSLTMDKPTRVNNTWVCNASDPDTSQLCGTNDLPISKVNCIPKESRCPLTQVKYEIGDLVTSRDPSLGKPITDLRLSEYGPPCIHWDKNFNTYPDKVKAVLFNNYYY